MSTVVVCISCSMIVESEVFCDCGALRPENASHLLVDGGIDPGGFPIFLVFILFFWHGGQTYYFHILFVIYRDLQNPPLYQPARHSDLGFLGQKRRIGDELEVLKTRKMILVVFLTFLVAK